MENFKSPAMITQSTSVQTDDRLPPWLIEQLTLLFKALLLPDPNSARAHFRIYGEALGKLPPQHVVDVLTAFRIGDLGDGRFCPKAAEVRQEVLRRMEADRIREAQERNRAEMLQQRRCRRERPPLSEDEKARARQKCEAFKQEVAATELRRSRGADEGGRGA